MSFFRHIDTKGPAEMGAVLEAIVRLSTLSEERILELVSEGGLEDAFPFEPNAEELPADSVAEEDLQEASVKSLNRVSREDLIQACLPNEGSRRRIERLAAELARQEEILRAAEEGSNR
jgi:hypothetical protein